MTPVEIGETRAFLILNRLRIEGRRRAVTLFGEGKTAREIVGQMESEDLLKELPVSANMLPFDPEKEIERCAEKGIGFLLYTDDDYPSLLKEIPDPPLLLYLKGRIAEEDRNAIAIVGTRHPSFYGRTQAKKFAGELAAKGLTIVSGLARGIDQIAHDGALQVSYGRTIAVMGCGLDLVYPKEHGKLFQKIAERGAVLSEYPFGTPPLPENFPRRNRILSGLSYATFVVEAHSRSGSLITAHQALEQGREVFALPGPVDQLTSHGTHLLIKEGAYLVETPEDILLALADRLKVENKFEPAIVEESAIPEREQTPFPLGQASSLEEEVPSVFTEKRSQSPDDRPSALIPNDECDVIKDLLEEEGPLARDEILEFTGFDPGKLPMLLLELELTKKIHRAQDGRYVLGC